MNYLKIDGQWVSIFDLAQAHSQIESDYNVNGMLRERPSNQRRNESTSCQLARMKYHDPRRWVDICALPEDEDEDDGDDDVRFIYLANLMKYGLPADEKTLAAIYRTFVPEFIAQYPGYELPEKETK